MFRQRFKAKDGSEPDKRKIKSTKVEQDGIVFDSKLENYLYNLLKENNINFDIKPVYELQPSFTYRHETVLGMKCTPDYYLPDYDVLIDCKGFANELAPVRYKLLKHKLFLEGKEPRIEMPSSQKACRAIIECLKTGWVLAEPLTESAATQRKNKLKKNGFTWHEGEWSKTILFGLRGCIAAYRAEYLMSLPKYEFEELLLKHK